MNAISPQPSRDVLDSEQILLNRLALVESRLNALCLRCGLGDGHDAATDLPASLLIDAESHAELAGGFYIREWDSEGRAFRWAGRTEYFEFRCFLDRRCTLPFSMRGIFAEGVAADAIRALVDYRPIPIRVTLHGGMASVEGRIPCDQLMTGFTLSFICPTADPVANDARRLSFAFSRLDVGIVDAAPGTPPAKVRGLQYA